MKLPAYGSVLRRALQDAGFQAAPDQILGALQDCAPHVAEAAADGFAAEIRKHPHATAAGLDEVRLVVLAEVEAAIRSVLAEWFVPRSAETERLMETLQQAFTARCAVLGGEAGSGGCP